MQDMRTGEMLLIEEEERKRLMEATQSASVQELTRKLKGVLHEGMEVSINGCNFRVRKITRKDVILRGVPSKEVAK